MLRHLAIPALLLSLGAVAARADTLPRRAAGLWEDTTELDGRLSTQRQCSGPPKARTEKREESPFRSLAHPDCTQTVTRTGDGYEIAQVCSFGPAKGDGRGRITGDFETTVRMEMTMVTTGVPNHPGTRTSTLVIASRRLGPCEAGQVPGPVHGGASR